MKVPVISKLTRRTDEDPIRQCERVVDCATATEPTRREPAVSDGDRGASHGSLVRELLPKQTQPHIADGPRQFPILHHTLDVQIFNHDARVGRGQPGGEFMECIGTYMCDTGMQPSQLALGLGPMDRKLHPARQLAVEASEL